MVSKAWVARLVAAALLLPGGIVVLAALGRLLKTMGDHAAGSVLDRLALAGGVVWVFVLLGLLLAIGVRQSVEPHDDLEA